MSEGKKHFDGLKIYEDTMLHTNIVVPENIKKECLEYSEKYHIHNAVFDLFAKLKDSAKLLINQKNLFSVCTYDPKTVANVCDKFFPGYLAKYAPDNITFRHGNDQTEQDCVCTCKKDNLEIKMSTRGQFSGKKSGTANNKNSTKNNDCWTYYLFISFKINETNINNMYKITSIRVGKIMETQWKEHNTSGGCNIPKYVLKNQFVYIYKASRKTNV